MFTIIMWKTKLFFLLLEMGLLIFKTDENDSLSTLEKLLIWFPTMGAWLGHDL